MGRATLSLRDFAERLIAYETRGNGSSGTKNPPALPVLDKLRPHLAILMGSTGFHALVSRALARSEAEVPSLRTVQVNADGSLAGFDKPGLQSPPDELARGSVVLIAELLGLLVAFVGASLTLRIVYDVWPKLARNDLQFLKDVTE